MRLRTFAITVSTATAVVFGCGSDPSGGSGAERGGETSAADPPGTSGDGRFGESVDGGPASDVGPCPGGGWTSLTGTVRDPSGTIPLYNAVVYVASEPLAPFADGVSCDRCGTTPSGKPIATTLTDAKGEFVLKDVPFGKDLEFVVQIGRWRRAVKVPAVKECTTTTLPADMTRLPRSKTEGDIPRIAITTGGADSLECFVRKLGMAAGEFTNPTGNGRIHLYQGVNPHRKDASGNPVTGSRISAQTPVAETLWGNLATLKKYDMVILACEGSPNPEDKAAHREKMRDYLDAGGRVFASHYHYGWFSEGPDPLPRTGDWNYGGTAGASEVEVDTSFPRGMAMRDWLVAVGASTTPGSVPTVGLKESVDRAPASGEPAETSRRWLYTKADDKPKYLSFNAPIGLPADQQCGRGVFTDVHVSSLLEAGGTFPSNCTSTGFTPQEKALLFLMMDLSACIQDDSKPPTPPAVVK